MFVRLLRFPEAAALLPSTPPPYSPTVSPLTLSLPFALPLRELVGSAVFHIWRKSNPMNIIFRVSKVLL